MKTALITGITGQDGAYLTEFLIKKLNALKFVNKWEKPAVKNIKRIYISCFGKPVERNFRGDYKGGR